MSIDLTGGCTALGRQPVRSILAEPKDEFSDAGLHALHTATAENGHAPGTYHGITLLHSCQVYNISVEKSKGVDRAQQSHSFPQTATQGQTVSGKHAPHEFRPVPDAFGALGLDRSSVAGSAAILVDRDSALLTTCPHECYSIGAMDDHRKTP